MKTTFAKFKLPLVVLVVIFLPLAVTPRAKADAVAVGFITFDVSNPGSPSSPGQNAFTLTNGTGAFSSFPDLPVSDDVTFLGASITPQGVSASSFGDQGPGISQVLFLDTDTFASALFQATLSKTVFTLGDGSVFQADSNLVSATLLPSSGTQLTPGVDFAVLDVSGAPVVGQTPEPREVLLLAVGLPLLLLVASRSMHRLNS